MKKKIIGILYSGKGPGKDEEIFLKLSKRKNIDLILINIFDAINESELVKKINKCDIIYNTTAEDFSLEIVKTIEELNKKVIDSSKAFYYIEDKWMFYLKCEKNKIPIPETILLPENIIQAKKELKEFKKWPVILKRVCGTMGQFVEKANNLEQAEEIIKKFWRKGSDKLPIIAQEMIRSASYRVTTIEDKIIQTALKENKAGWKATGNYAKSFKKFEVDNELKKIMKELYKFVGIKICGTDLLKKDGKWVVLEVNSEPDFGFFEDEREKLIGEVLDYLKQQT